MKTVLMIIVSFLVLLTCYSCRNGEREIPIIYHNRFKPEPLSRSQKEKILNEANSLAPKDQQIWFIRVLYNRLSHTYNIAVYYTPDQTTERIRKGKFVQLGSLRNEMIEKWFKSVLGWKSSEQDVGKLVSLPQDKCLEDYCQVSLSSKPFSFELEIPPQNTLLPFLVPTNLTDKEIIEIIDLIRETYPSHKEPIICMIKEDNRIGIMTGTVESGTSGMGHYLEYMKRNGEYGLVVEDEWTF